MNDPKPPSDDQDAVAPGADSAPDVVEVDETGAEKPIRGLDISDSP